MKNIQVTTIGGATRDIFFVSEKGRIIDTPENLEEQKLLGFEYGAKIKSDEVYFSIGGGACNLSVGLTRLGISAIPFVFIGNDENGEAILSNLVREGVKVSSIKRLDDERTGFSFILIKKDTKEHVAFLYRGANDSLRVKGDGERLASSDWIYLSSLYGDDWKETTEEIVKIVKKKNQFLAYNPGTVQVSSGYNKIKEFLEYVEILVVNKDEAIELCLSKLGKIKDDPEWLVSELLKSGARVVVVTDGIQGAWAGDKDEIFCADKFSDLGEKDTTGAGDSFGSGFFAGYVKYGKDIKKALQFGLINSGSVVSEIGAQKGLLSEKNILEYLDRIKIKVC